MTLPAALLNKTCDIYTYTEADDGTTGQMIKTWGVLSGGSSVPCCRTTLKGDKRIIAGKPQVEASDKIYMNYRTDFDEKARILIDSEYMEILDIGDAAGRLNHLELMCRIIK